MFLSKDYLPRFVFPVLLCCFFMSCVSTKQSVYFHDLPDTVLAPIQGNFEPVIQKNDVLQITVSSMNVEDVVVYNTPSMATVGGVASAGPQATGFLVDDSGYIQYPVLGQVKVTGLTKSQLSKSIRDQLTVRKLLVDPVVSVRFLNYRVTVIGEVTRPQVVNIGSDRVTILEALGLAGDITAFGKKDNVMLIRESEDGTRTVKRLNLNDRSLLSSPYYYLRSNDVVYVEPNKAKVASTNTTRQILPLVLSGLSLLVIVIDRLVVH